MIIYNIAFIFCIFAVAFRANVCRIKQLN